jgi:hypothetical protein
MITGKGPSARHEIFYFTESDLASVRIDDFKYMFITQPGGWLGTKDHPNSPILVNLRLDPFERTIWPANQSLHGSLEYFGWYQYQFWRYVFVQQYVAKLAMTAIEFPPMQKGAGFNLDAVKEKIAEATKARQ